MCSSSQTVNLLPRVFALERQRCPQETYTMKVWKILLFRPLNIFLFEKSMSDLTYLPRRKNIQLSDLKATKPFLI